MRPPPARAFVGQLITLTLLLLVFSGSLGLGAVWVRQEISGTANRSHGIENKIADVERRLDEVNAEVAAALNPSTLLRQNQIMMLGLISPLETHIVRPEGSPELRLASKRNNEIFKLSGTRLGSENASGNNPYSFKVITASLH
jgi:hypothetical protein